MYVWSFMYWFTFPFHSQLHLSGPAAVRRPLLSRLSVQLVCRCGLGSLVAGQPHPEGAAAQGSTRHQPGQTPRLSAAAVHQHPLPGRTMKIMLQDWRRCWLAGCVWVALVCCKNKLKCQQQWTEPCHIIVVLQGDKIDRRVSKESVLCVCMCVFSVWAARVLVILAWHL